MAEIFKAGSSEESSYRYSCKKCKSIIDFEASDIKWPAKRKGKYPYVVCPLCKARISWAMVKKDGEELLVKEKDLDKRVEAEAKERARYYQPPKPKVLDCSGVDLDSFVTKLRTILNREAVVSDTLAQMCVQLLSRYVSGEFGIATMGVQETSHDHLTACKSNSVNRATVRDALSILESTLESRKKTKE